MVERKPMELKKVIVDGNTLFKNNAGKVEDYIALLVRLKDAGYEDLYDELGFIMKTGKIEAAYLIDAERKQFVGITIPCLKSSCSEFFVGALPVKVVLSMFNELFVKKEKYLAILNHFNMETFGICALNFVNYSSLSDIETYDRLKELYYESTYKYILVNEKLERTNESIYLNKGKKLIGVCNMLNSEILSKATIVSYTYNGKNYEFEYRVEYMPRSIRHFFCPVDHERITKEEILAVLNNAK